jgi:hypothetical protein
VRFSIDPWDASYGIANEVDLVTPTSADVNVDVEVPGTTWEPVDGGGREADTVLFVDGVRRVEARVWLDDGIGHVYPGICASYAAGATRCDGVATVGPVIVERGLFTAYGGIDVISTSVGPFPLRLSATDSPEGLSLALQERMGQAEVAAAEACTADDPADITVIDGPLRGRQHLAKTVGYIKTHHVAYLPPDLHAMVGRLCAGQRTPLFMLGTSWSRLAWYLRLPGASDVPWTGVVRCECSADLPMLQAAALADTTASTLPRFASETYKEPRAPQNLYPIAGLERELRRRMGDPHLLYRALRRSAHGETRPILPTGESSPAATTR